MNSSDNNVLQGRFTLHTFFSKFQSVSVKITLSLLTIIMILIYLMYFLSFYICVKNPNCNTRTKSTYFYFFYNYFIIFFFCICRLVDFFFAYTHNIYTPAPHINILYFSSTVFARVVVVYLSTAYQCKKKRPF